MQGFERQELCIGESAVRIFSDDALIITGRVIKTMGKSQTDGISQQVRERVVYSKQSKQQYINNLRALFRTAEFVNVDFSDIELMRHGSNPNFYGVRLRQKWASQRYNGNQYADDGYVFLLWDFTDETQPKIHVRTWTPKRPYVFMLLSHKNIKYAFFFCYFWKITYLCKQFG